MAVLPTISIIVITHNEADKLERCLGSLVLQQYPSFEIIVVDANSTDSSAIIAEKYTSKVFRVDLNIIGYSRQLGVDLSSGSIVAFIDPDTVFPSNDLLSEAVGAFAQRENIAIVWPRNIGPKNSKIARCFFYFWDEFARHRISSTPNVTLGANCFYLKSAIVKVGGFNKKLNYVSDTDLTQRILQNNYSCVLLEKPIIHHTNTSMKEFTKKQLWGARDFVEYGSRRLGMTHRNAAYELFVLGTRSMVKTVAKRKDLSGFILPLMLTIRGASYAIFYLRKLLSPRNMLRTSVLDKKKSGSHHGG